MASQELKASGRTAPRTRFSRAGWWVLVLLLIGGIINYLDRASLSLAAPEMIEELDLTTTDIGLMGTVFSWTYAVMQLPAGWIVDRFGSKPVYAISIALWSGAIAAMGACSRMPAFLAARVGLGIGEAPCFPTSAKITAAWFPRSQRGLATAFWDTSSKWGPALAPLILIPVLTSFGWRTLFYAAGAAGLLFSLLFWLTYRNPSRPADAGPAPDAETGAGPAAKEAPAGGSARGSWMKLFTERSIWGLMLGFFCTIWIWNIFLTFMPLYLLETQGLKLESLGLYASIPWIGGIVGELAGGWVSNRLIVRGVPALTVRRGLIAVCAVLAGVSVVFVPLATGLTGTMITLTSALAFVSAATGGAWTLAGDIAPQHLVGSVGAIQNFGGYFGGAFSPLVAGMIVDATGSWSLAFYSAGVIAALAGACYWFGVRRPITVPAAA
jgi:sugar phosphate permease